MTGVQTCALPICSNFAGEDTAASWCLELDPQNHVGEPALLCMCPQTSTLPLCPKHPSTQQVLTGLELTEIRLLLPPNVGIQGIYHHTFGYKFLFFFFFNFYLFILCTWVHCFCLQTLQKTASDPITDGCEPPCGCWELNSGPLEEQPLLLTAEQSLQHYKIL